MNLLNEFCEYWFMEIIWNIQKWKRTRATSCKIQKSRKKHCMCNLYCICIDSSIAKCLWIFNVIQILSLNWLIIYICNFFYSLLLLLLLMFSIASSMYCVLVKLWLFTVDLLVIIFTLTYFSFNLIHILYIHSMRESLVVLLHLHLFHWKIHRNKYLLLLKIELDDRIEKYKENTTIYSFFLYSIQCR